MFLESFMKAVQTDVEKFQSARYIKDNLSKEERLAAQSLRHNSDIVIKPEDKSPAFVIQDSKIT